MRTEQYLYIIDLDGTLVDSLADLTASVNVMRSHFALQPLPPLSVRRMVGQGARNLVERALPGADEFMVASGLALFLAHNEAHLVDRTVLYPGVADTLAALAAAGHTLALLSNKNEGLCRQLLHHFNLSALFAAVIGGDSLPSRKPSPEPVLHLMQLLGKQPESTLMVGDSRNDIAAGHGAAVMTVGCSYGYGEPAELESATWRIDTFAALLALP